MMKILAFAITISFLLYSGLSYSQENDPDLTPEKDVTQIDSTAALYQFLKGQNGLVLLKNHGGLLPLNMDEIKTIAMIGPTLFSSSNSAENLLNISPYRGFADDVGGTIQLLSSIGVNMKNDVVPLDSSAVYIGQGINGFSAKYYNGTDPSGKPEIFHIDKQINFNWDTTAPFPVLGKKYAISWDATLIPQHGPVKVKIIHTDGCRLYLDGKLLINAWEPGPLRTDSAWLNIKKGASYNILVEYFTDGGPAFIKMGFDFLMSNMIAGAVDKARRADAVIVFVGLPHGGDYNEDSGHYPEIPNQSQLIKAILEVNPNTIVVLQTDSPVDIESWAFAIPVIIQAWPPNEESGSAVAQLIAGNINPTAKLPYNWAMNENQNYNTRFPFGFGMSYTTFGIGKLMMKRKTDGSGWLATVEIRNLGDRAGTECLQLYIRDPEDNNNTISQLKAFENVTLLPSQKKTIGIHIPYSSFEYFDKETGKWTIKPGMYDILVGTSAEDIKLIKTIELKEKHINLYYNYE